MSMGYVNIYVFVIDGDYAWDSLERLMSKNLIGWRLRYSLGQSKARKKKVKDHVIMEREMEDKT